MEERNHNELAGKPHVHDVMGTRREAWAVTVPDVSKPLCECTNSDLRTPEEWCKVFRVEIMDPDGWRSEGDPKWTDPISAEEFKQRMWISTIRSY